MSANITKRVRLRPAVAFAAAVLMAVVAGPADGDEVLTSAQAIERARALEGGGLLEEAALYLRGLILESRSIARDAPVLLELARLTNDLDEAADLANRATTRTRDPQLLLAAHVFLGDLLYARGLYLSAALEYGRAGTDKSISGADEALLKRAASLLAAGDAQAALDAYRDLAAEGATGETTIPLAELGVGRALLRAGRPEEAAREFERILATYPVPDVRIQALAGAAASHEEAGNMPAAIMHLTVLSDEFPESFEGILAGDRARNIPLPESADGENPPPSGSTGPPAGDAASPESDDAADDE
jgi:tetratricopeptide (TPR) repeat protein